MDIMLGDTYVDACNVNPEVMEITPISVEH